jgi:chromosome segregation ATPase
MMSLLASAITALLAIVPRAEPEPERDNRALLAELADALSQRDAAADELISAWRKIDLLQSQVDAAWERHASLAVELDHAREDAQAWRERALACQTMQAAQQHQGQLAMMANPLASMGRQQATMNQQMAACQAMQNAFAHPSAYENFCNCVPARHDMLLRPR